MKWNEDYKEPRRHDGKITWLVYAEDKGESTLLLSTTTYEDAVACGDRLMRQSPEIGWSIWCRTESYSCNTTLINRIAPIRGATPAEGT